MELRSFVLVDHCRKRAARRVHGNIMTATNTSRFRWQKTHSLAPRRSAPGPETPQELRLNL